MAPVFFFFFFIPDALHDTAIPIYPDLGSVLCDWGMIISQLGSNPGHLVKDELPTRWFMADLTSVENIRNWKDRTHQTLWTSTSPCLLSFWTLSRVLDVFTSNTQVFHSVDLFSSYSCGTLIVQTFFNATNIACFSYYYLGKHSCPIIQPA